MTVALTTIGSFLLGVLVAGLAIWSVLRWWFRSEDLLVDWFCRFFKSHPELLYAVCKRVAPGWLHYPKVQGLPEAPEARGSVCK